MYVYIYIYIYIYIYMFLRAADVSRGRIRELARFCSPSGCFPTRN